VLEFVLSQLFASKASVSTQKFGNQVKNNEDNQAALAVPDGIAAPFEMARG
jgi:hypothetical protein